MANDNNSFTAITACERHARVHCPFCILCVNNHRENNWSQYGRSEAREIGVVVVGCVCVGGHIHSEWWWTVRVRDLWFTWWLVEGSRKKHCVTEVAVGFGWLFPLYPHWFWALGEDFQGHIANWRHFWSPYLRLKERKNEIYSQTRSFFENVHAGYYVYEVKCSKQADFNRTLKYPYRKLFPSWYTFLSHISLLDKTPRPSLLPYSPP